MFGRFDKAVKSCGYNQRQEDRTMFYMISVNGNFSILIVFMDDIVLMGDDEEGIRKLKGQIAHEFETKDLGSLKYFLGMEFARSQEGIFANQRKYTLDLLHETGMLVVNQQRHR